MNRPTSRWKHPLEFTQEELDEARNAIERAYDPRLVLEGYVGGYLACIVDVWLDIIRIPRPIHLTVVGHSVSIGAESLVRHLEDLTDDVGLDSADIRSEQSTGGCPEFRGTWVAVLV